MFNWAFRSRDSSRADQRAHGHSSAERLGPSASSPATHSEVDLEHAATGVMPGVATAERPYDGVPPAMLSAKAYSLSTPLLEKPHGELVGDSRTVDGDAESSHVSALLTSPKSVSYTFNPIQHAYEQHLKDHSKTGIVSHCTPLSKTFYDCISQSESPEACVFVGETRLKKARRSVERETVDALVEAMSAMSTEESDSKSREEESKEDLLPLAATFDDSPQGIFERYLEQLPLVGSERRDIVEFHKWIMYDRLSKKLISDDICLGDFILCFFAAFSPTNPDTKGCWRRWIQFKFDNPLKDVNYRRVAEFYDSDVFNVAYDSENRPLIVASTVHYDDTFGPEITAQSMVLFVTSLLWDLSTNTMDFVALRKGVAVYSDLSHFSISMVSWNVVAAIKSAAIAYPFGLTKIYCVNTPTIIYLLRQFAAKVLLPHAMEKVIILPTLGAFFEDGPGVRHRTALEYGGDWDIHGGMWMKLRGYCPHTT